MQLEDLDFDLPEELIAQHPAAQRDACRLMHLRRPDGSTTEHRFHDLPTLLRPGDLLVRNTSRVLPARLCGEKEGDRARCELLLTDPEETGRWWALVRPARRLPPGSVVRLADGTRIRVVATGEAGARLLQFPADLDPLQVAERLGSMPLPPYIRRAAEPGDAETYQTVYASEVGSVAAPTAGLHFTHALLRRLREHGIECADLLLHIGLATFEPIRVSDPLQHRMHWERFEIRRAELRRIEETRAAGGRIVAVGTTAARVLESLAWRDERRGDVELEELEGRVRGRTRLFIHPPHEFRSVDALLTNFHLPRSTLLLLVDALAGHAAIRAAYAEAVACRFRFFSYGDAMLIE
jgi:S-adenosylmethionine:tRNA ribosyltransferase-isomerase